MADERAAGNCPRLRLIDKGIGMAQCRGGGAGRAGHRVVVVAKDDIAIRSQVVSDVVVPIEAVSVAMTDNDDRQFAHRSDVGWKVEILAPTGGGNAERRSNASVNTIDHLGHGLWTCRRRVVHDVETRFTAKSVDEVARAQRSILVAIEHDVVADPKPETGVGVQS